MLLGAGTSTHVLSRASPALCALPAYIFNMSKETKPTKHTTLSPPIDLTFQRDNPSALLLTLCLVFHFNGRGRPCSLGLTGEQCSAVSPAVSLLSDQRP